MRLKKEFSPWATSFFYFTQFATFVKQWKNERDWVRIGVWPEYSGQLKMQDPRDVRALILAGTRPDLLGCEHPRCTLAPNPLLSEMRARFFATYAEAPDFVLAILTHLRKVSTPIRVALDTFYEFTLHGKRLNINTATDGEIAQVVKMWTATRVTPVAVKRQRQLMIREQAAFLADPARCEEARSYFENTFSKGHQTAS